MKTRSQITLCRQADHWHAAAITDALSNSRRPIIVPVVAPTEDAQGSQR